MVSLVPFCSLRAPQRQRQGIGAQQWLPVSRAGYLGAMISTLIIGVALWVMLGLVDMHIRLVYCLTFGARISPMHRLPRLWSAASAS